MLSFRTVDEIQIPVPVPRGIGSIQFEKSIFEAKNRSPVQSNAGQFLRALESLSGPCQGIKSGAVGEEKTYFQKSTFCPLQGCRGATIFSPPRSEQLRLTADTDFGWLRFPGPAEKPTNWRIRGTNS